jgi:hypothetical protein
MGLHEQQVIEQSKLAYNVWKKLWENNCEQNYAHIKTSHSQILNKYKDKIIVLFAFGPSLADNINEFKEYTSNGTLTNYVVGCVDKAFTTLCDNGVQPDFCVIADGSISIRWIENADPENIKKCSLISNVYASPDWVKLWVKHSSSDNIYWFLNKDNINTHHHFSVKANYFEVIEAASNVGNTTCVFAVKIFGGRKVILYGYDYSWKGLKYYGNGNHTRANVLGTNRELDIHGDLVFVSDNMKFSADWLTRYVDYAYQNYGAEIINRTGNGILNIRSELHEIAI